MSKSKIACQFIVSYYRTLFTDPSIIVNFYAENAKIIRKNVFDSSGDRSFSYQHQSFEEILPYKPENNIVRIFTYNSAILSEEIVVTTYGEISRDESQQTLNFSHTFVLSPNGSKYFLISDVFCQFNASGSNQMESVDLVGAEAEVQTATRSTFCFRFNQPKPNQKEKPLQANTRTRPFFPSS